MQWVFWSSVGILAYTFAGYPAWLWLRSRYWPRPVRASAFTPSVSIVMVVRNEAGVLDRKLRNLLELDYPGELCEILVVSDGSTDATHDILRQHASNPRIRIVLSPKSRGKAAGLNDAMAIAHGEIIMFTDARQKIEPAALRLLVRNFADPEVGCASGELMLGDPDSGEVVQGVGLYWQIEKSVRELEAASGSMVGATGALYAARRELLTTIPPETILDDVYLPMQVVRQGKRAVFDPQARAWDGPSLGARREFSRKVRTLGGNLQLVQLAPWLLSSQNPILLEFVSHKLLRLVVPFALAALFLTSLALGGPFYRAALILQLGFYALSLLALSRLLKGSILQRIGDAPATFVLLNGAAAVALANFLAGKRVAWKQ